MGGVIPTDWYGEPLRALDGGYSGETYLGGEGADRVVVRIYARDPGRAAVDAGLLTLVRGLVPVPEVLELRRPTTTTPAILVTELVTGTRLDQALAQQPDWLDQATVGRSLGRILNTLAGIPFLRFATFADGDLTLSNEQLPHDLQSWAEQLRSSGRLSTWPEADWQALISLVDSAEDLLAEDAHVRPSRAVLTHSDVNPKNILVDPATSEVSALLDWEFAHAGSPYADLGNFTRFERDPRLVGPLLDTLAEPPPRGPARRLALGRAADLWALVELAGRPQPGPVPDLATELLLAQARSGDLDAWPWPTSRVAPAG
jgi:aminoglycoside phosphotransferase (APT) family kinase protein